MRSTVVLILLLVIAFPSPAYAYIDPGSGSMMLQLLFGGVAGAIVSIRLFWSRLSIAFGRDPADRVHRRK